MRYILGVLLALLIIVSSFSYHQSNKIEALALDVSTYKSAAELSEKGKKDAEASCLVTVESINKYYSKQQELETSQQSTGGAILTLPTLTIKEKANEAHKLPQKATEYSDDDRLSPDTMRLLDEAYCYGDKNGCTPSPK